MLRAGATAALALGLALLAGRATAQDAPAAGPEVEVEEVVVVGQPLQEQAAAFVATVSAPASHDRGLARWRDPVCIGVANLQGEPAQYVIDRISDVANALEIRTGRPGCRANVLITFTTDGAATARALVERDRSVFDLGVGGLARGDSALNAFMSSGAPVRWWHVSIPVDPDTGERSVRIPGDQSTAYNGQGRDPTAPSAVLLRVFAPSRIRDPEQDNLNKVIIIVDVDRLGDTNLVQLADYLALVALAQIDPAARTEAFDTILNVFAAPQSVAGLTDWDQSYLQALYRGGYMQSTDIRVQSRIVASLMARYEREGAAPAE